MRNPVTPDDLDSAVDVVAAMLTAAIDADWSIPAGPVTWSCAETVEHMGKVGVHYAAQLAVGAETVHVRVMAEPHPEGTNARRSQFLQAGGRLLSRVARAMPPDASALHPWGQADVEGWVAIACAEFLLHGADIAAGLGCAFDPDDEVCARVLARVAPEHAALAYRADLGGWGGLTYAAGRRAVDGLPAVGQWRWRAGPLDGPRDLTTMDSHR